MILSWPFLDTPIEWSDYRNIVLVIENHKALRTFIETINAAICGMETDLCVSDGMNPLHITKNVLLLMDPFSLDLNSKRLLSKIHQDITALSENYTEELQSIQFQINDLASRISFEMEYPTSFSEIENSDEIVRLMNFHPDIENESFQEKIIIYMLFHRQYLSVNLFIIYGLHSFLSKEEMNNLKRKIIYHNLNVLFLEPAQPVISEFDQTIVIDCDLCIIR